MITSIDVLSVSRLNPIQILGLYCASSSQRAAHWQRRVSRVLSVAAELEIASLATEFV